MLAHSSTHQHTSSDTISLWNTWHTPWNLQQHSSKALRLYHTSAHFYMLWHTPAHVYIHLCTLMHTPAHFCIPLHTPAHVYIHFCTLLHTFAHFFTLLHTPAHTHTGILPHTPTHSNALHSVKVWRRWANFTHPIPISLFPHNLNLPTPSHPLAP